MPSWQLQCTLMSAPTASRPTAGRGACALVSIVSVLVVFAWTAARIHYACGGNWTAAFDTGAIFRVPPDLDAGTYRFEGTGYDGQFYRYLAHDPFLRQDYFRFMDAPQMRSRRLLVPLAAWLFGFGRRSWIDGSYIAVETFLVALGGYWCARILARRGCSPFWGFLFVIVPAVLASFDRMLVDGPLTALFAGFLLYSEEGRWTRVWVLAMLAALTRETGLLIIAALVTDCLWHRDFRRAAWFASSGVPAAVWFVYVALRLPHDTLPNQFAVPVWGLFQRLLQFRSYPDPQLQLLLRVTDVLAVVGLLGSIILAVWWLRERTVGPEPLSVGLFAGLALLLDSPNYMTDAFGFGRPVSPLLLWIMIEAVRRRTWSALAPPLLISASISLVFAKPFFAIWKGVLGR